MKIHGHSEDAAPTAESPGGSRTDGSDPAVHATEPTTGPADGQPAVSESGARWRSAGTTYERRATGRIYVVLSKQCSQ